MYDRVVILLDGSELAEHTVAHVASLIRGRSSRVHLLTVAPADGEVAGVDMHADDARRVDDRLRAEREVIEYLRAVARRLEPVTSDVWLAVRYGRPADEILTFVNEIGADLIAMSTHGRSGLGRWVFGTVADRVARGATCPVLLVRAEQPASPTPYRRIVIPLDGSPQAEQIVPYVKALASPDPTELTRVYLISVLTTGVGDRAIALLTSYPPGLQLATSAVQQAEFQLQSYLRSVANVLRTPRMAVHTAVRQGAPAEEILACAAEVGADLICMTTHGFSGPGRWVYGNVANKVLQGARCPVLFVRPTV